MVIIWHTSQKYMDKWKRQETSLDLKLQSLFLKSFYCWVFDDMFLCGWELVEGAGAPPTSVTRQAG